MINNNEHLLLLLKDIFQEQPQHANSKWVYFTCPFCKKNGKIKKKLAVNTETLDWKCWVCRQRGSNLFSLIRKIGKWNFKDRVKNISNNFNIWKIKEKKHNEHNIELPKQYTPLSLNKKFIMRNKVIKYLKVRGIEQYQIQKFQIGFCQSGVYQNRIIIPSYDENNNLNYFTARSINGDSNLKYLNPKVQRNSIIIFQNMINWKYPVIITQGVFDAITVNFNSIPLMGKVLSNTLLQKLLYYDAEIFLTLDNDAKDDQYKMLVKLNNKGLNNIYYMDLKNKDPNEMGRMNYWRSLMKNKKKFTVHSSLDIIKERVGSINK